MTPRRRAALALSGGFVIAGALVAPASMVAAQEQLPAAATVSVACIDRTVALLSTAEAGLGLSSVTPLVQPPFTEPPSSINPAVAVVTLTNPTAEPFDVLVVRDADAPVPFTVAPGVTVSTAFDVAEGGTSVFRVTDPAGEELALVASTADCEPPAGWCDTERAPGDPVAADHADVCPLPGDEVLAAPEAVAADAPAPTGRVVEGPEEEEVLGAAVYQTAPPPPMAPPGAIVIPAPTPPPSPAPAPAADEQAAQVTAEPELALSGSQSEHLAQAAGLLLGLGVAVTGVGRRRVDAELDARAGDAMARIFVATGRE